MCKDLDPAIYHTFIVDSFAPRQQTAVYADFVSLLGKISPLHILTTNVDEMLEKTLPLTETVQRTDLSRCVELLHNRRSFVAKLHGSVSAVQSTVFATADYDALVGNSSYINLLKYAFTGCTVVFLGYGVRDGYVIKLLSENVEEMQLFGPGPHFVVTNEAVSVASLQQDRILPQDSPRPHRSIKRVAFHNSVASAAGRSQRRCLGATGSSTKRW